MIRSDLYLLSLFVARHAMEKIVSIFLALTNIILHGIGLCLLFTLYKRRGEKSYQRCYLLNLSLAELVQNIFRLTIHLLLLYDADHRNRSLCQLICYFRYVTNTAVYYQCFASMFLLTGDRLLCILLGMRYTIIWNFKKTIYVIAMTWFFNGIISIGMCVHMTVTMRTCKQLHACAFNKVVYLYVPTSLFVIFLAFTIFTYSVLFYKYVVSRRQFSMNSNENHRRTIKSAITNSKFFVSIMLISTFLLFMVIPASVATFYYIVAGTMPSMSYIYYLNISVLLSDTADGLIYVFLLPSVRKFLLQIITAQKKKIRVFFLSYKSSNISDSENGSTLHINQVISNPEKQPAPVPVKIKSYVLTTWV